jgi:hypothetical protein
MRHEDLTRLTALRDAGVITAAEFGLLAAPAPSAPTTVGWPAHAPVAAGGAGSQWPVGVGQDGPSRLGLMAGTAASALAGVMAGNALDRMLFDAAGSDPAGSGASEEPVEWAYEGYTEYVDTDGDGEVDAAWTTEMLVVDDGSPTAYAHTEYTEYVDTDANGSLDTMRISESAASEEWVGEGLDDGGWPDEGFFV